jgi:RimJ/RimL family protein N-acetyltransferase
VENEIRTARLLLRPLRLDDFEAHYAMVDSDPQVTWRREVLSREQAQAALQSRIRDWEAYGFGMWAVIEQATQQMTTFRKASI